MFMTKPFLLLSMLAILSISSMAQTHQEKKVPDKQPIAGEAGTKTADLKSVIALINESLKIAEKDLQKHNVTLSEAEITLTTISEKSGGGGFKIFAKASGKWYKEITNTVTYKFVTPKVSPDEKLSKTTTRFAEAIVNSAAAYRLTGDLAKLVKDGFEQEISFSIKAEKGAGVELELFGILEIEGGVDFTNTVEHSAKLTFRDLKKPF